MSNPTYTVPLPRMKTKITFGSRRQVEDMVKGQSLVQGLDVHL